MKLMNVEFIMLLSSFCTFLMGSLLSQNFFSNFIFILSLYLSLNLAISLNRKMNVEFVLSPALLVDYFL